MFHQLRSFILGIAVTLALVTGGYVIFAQGNMSQLSNPLAIDIHQSVPILADILVPLDSGEVITTSLPLTLGVNLQISLVGATIIDIQPVEKPAVQPTVQIRDAQNVPGMVGIDDLNLPYKLKAPEGLVLKEWTAMATEDGGFEYDFIVSTPGRKFDSHITASVAYYNANDERIGGSGTTYIGSKSKQDRDTRSYRNGFDCDWGNCAGVLDAAEYYIVEFEVNLIEFP